MRNGDDEGEAQRLVEQGNACVERGEVDRAIESYRQAVALVPGHARAHYNLGVMLHRSGHLDAADRHYAIALDSDPRMFRALVNRGNVQRELGDASAAARFYARALDIEPGDAHARKNLALLAAEFETGGAHEAAVTAYEALSKAGLTAARLGLGNSLLALGKIDRAVEAYGAALASAASDEERSRAHFNLGIAHFNRGSPTEASSHFRAAVELPAALNQAQLHQAQVHLGLIAKACGDGESAQRIFEEVIASEPGNVFALNNLATLLLERGNLERADELLDQALRIDPGCAGAHVNVAVLALRRHDFAKGWEAYEMRSRMKRGFAAVPEGRPALLSARDLGDVKLLGIRSEQGIGDQILFSTLLPEIVSRGIRAVVEVDARLIEAYRRSLPALRFAATGDESAFAGCDAQVAQWSLPRLLRPDVESFRRQPRALLAADPSRVEPTRRSLGDGRFVAISWRSIQSATRKDVEQRKSIPLENFAAFKGRGVKLLDLQYGDMSQERQAFDRANPGLRAEVEGLDRFRDLEGMLAAIEACELVVTSSNVTAHLAGALGKHTWLVYLTANPLLHYWAPGPDGHSLWYPSVEVATHPSWTDWPTAFQELSKRLP